jgi:hypothetical protein
MHGHWHLHGHLARSCTHTGTGACSAPGGRAFQRAFLRGNWLQPDSVGHSWGSGCGVALCMKEPCAGTLMQCGGMRSRRMPSRPCEPCMACRISANLYNAVHAYLPPTPLALWQYQTMAHPVACNARIVRTADSHVSPTPTDTGRMDMCSWRCCGQQPAGSMLQRGFCESPVLLSGSPGCGLTPD